MHEDEGSENVKEKSESTLFYLALFTLSNMEECLERCRPHLRSVSMFKKGLEENGKLVVVCLRPP